MAVSTAGDDHLRRARYKVYAHRSKSNHWRALIDRGANGSIARSDMRVIESTGNHIDLSGIDDHTVRQLPLVHAGGVTRSQKGDVIIIVNQAAHMPEGRTILSTGQLEHYKIKVDERSMKVTGKLPCVTSLEGHQIPIETRRGLPYLRLRPGTDEEWKTLPKIVLTSPHHWNPSKLDHKVDETWYSQPVKESEYMDEIPFDEMGNLKDAREDEIESDDEDRNHQAIDRVGIKAFLHKIVEPEMQAEFYACNIEGHLHSVRWDEPWEKYVEDSSDDDDVPPLSKGEASSSSSEDESSDDDQVRRVRWMNVNSGDDEDMPELLQRPYCSSSEDDLSGDEDARGNAAARRRSRMRFSETSSQRKCHVTTRSKSKGRVTSSQVSKQSKQKASNNATKTDAQKKPTSKRRRKPRRRKHLDDFKETPLDDPDPDDENSDGVTPSYNNPAKAAQCTKEELVQPQEDTGERVTEAEP
ncbi:MAG: hypothetical protein LC687_07375, partial [Actinobacteria bacterium]|nr:hypothetical protein [Actinomycetota bacterium]